MAGGWQTVFCKSRASAVRCAHGACRHSRCAGGRRRDWPNVDHVHGERAHVAIQSRYEKADNFKLTSERSRVCLHVASISEHSGNAPHRLKRVIELDSEHTDRTLKFCPFDCAPPCGAARTGPAHPAELPDGHSLAADGRLKRCAVEANELNERRTPGMRPACNGLSRANFSQFNHDQGGPGLMCSRSRRFNRQCTIILQLRTHVSSLCHVATLGQALVSGAARSKVRLARPMCALRSTQQGSGALRREECQVQCWDRFCSAALHLGSV